MVDTRLMPQVKGPLLKVNALDVNEEEEFIDVLRDMVTLENELEQVKITLALQQDFNL